MLSKAQIAGIVKRWLAGEELRDIARDFEGIGYHTLLHLTKEARQKTDKYRKHSPLTEAQIKEIAERWAKGEQLKAIMADYPGIGFPLFAKATREARQAKSPQFFRGPLPTLKPEQIDNAVRRWRKGESLAVIAREYRVKKGMLAQATRAARYGFAGDLPQKRKLPQKLPLGPRPISRLSAETLAEIMARWEAGEDMTAISRDYRVSLDWLLKATREARREKGPRPKAAILTAEKTSSAIERWDGGETLKFIAQDLGVSATTLRKYMERFSGRSFMRLKHQKSRLTPPAPLLSEIQIADAVARWNAGEPLHKIAIDYGLSKSQLSRITQSARGVIGPRKFNVLSDEQRADVVARYQNREPLHKIAASYGMSTTTLTRITRIDRAALPKKIYHLTDEQLADAVNRLQQGEMIANIAASHQIPVGPLTRIIKARHGKNVFSRSQREKKPALSEEQIAEIVLRWKAGETIKDMAPMYGLAMDTVAKKTKAARAAVVKERPVKQESQKFSQARLTPEQLQEAVTRWENGERLEVIAPTLGVHVNTLSKWTKEARRNSKIRQRAGYLTDEQIADIQMRLLNGEPAEQVAASFPIPGLADKIGNFLSPISLKPPALSPEQVAEAMERWKSGEWLKTIAKSLGVSKGTLSKYTFSEREAYIAQLKGKLPQHKQWTRPPSMTSDQIAIAIERWKNGTTLLQIAAELGLSVQVVSNYTKAARGAAYARRVLTEITDAHIVEALAKWRNGERLHDIARAMNVCLIKLGQLTKTVRSQEKKPKGWHSKLVGDRLAQAIERWKNGQPLHKIAEDMGVSYSLLYQCTSQARAALNQRKRHELITEVQVRDAIGRWAKGEAILNIAKEWNVSGAELFKRTREGRNSLKRSVKSVSLSAGQLEDVMTRWTAGEHMIDIARSYEMNYHALCEATKGLRSRSTTGVKLSEEQVQQAVKRWHAGESMAEIARSYNASYSTLLLDTRPFRVAQEETKPNVRLHLLDALEIKDALTRWTAGESVEDIARHYNMTKEKITETLIYERWRRGEPVKQVAQDFHKGRGAARKIIVTFKELYSGKSA